MGSRCEYTIVTSILLSTFSESANDVVWRSTSILKLVVPSTVTHTKPIFCILLTIASACTFPPEKHEEIKDCHCQNSANIN